MVQITSQNKNHLSKNIFNHIQLVSELYYVSGNSLLIQVHLLPSSKNVFQNVNKILTYLLRTYSHSMCACTISEKMTKVSRAILATMFFTYTTWKIVIFCETTWCAHRNMSTLHFLKKISITK
jgi:hypothetical protein